MMLRAFADRIETSSPESKKAIISAGCIAFVLLLSVIIVSAGGL